MWKCTSPASMFTSPSGCYYESGVVWKRDICAKEVVREGVTFPHTLLSLSSSCFSSFLSIAFQKVCCEILQLFTSHFSKTKKKVVLEGCGLHPNVLFHADVPWRCGDAPVWLHGLCASMDFLCPAAVQEGPTPAPNHFFLFLSLLSLSWSVRYKGRKLAQHKSEIECFTPKGSMGNGGRATMSR